MRFLLVLYIVGACSAGPFAFGATSDWLSAPKPKFPTSSLKEGSEGSVKLRVTLAPDGHVVAANIVRPSGDPMLDRAAHQAVLRWRTKPSAIKPLDLTKGRETVVEFEQEAFAGIRYRDRIGAFSNPKSVEVWMYAPFPEYPYYSRVLHHTGKASVRVIIGNDGQVATTQLVQSSGFGDLDTSAVAALRHWRAHKQYAGKSFIIPINFTMGRS
jgi:TonB family protein